MTESWHISIHDWFLSAEDCYGRWSNHSQSKRKEWKLGLFLFTELQHSASQFSVLPMLQRLIRSRGKLKNIWLQYYLRTQKKHGIHIKTFLINTPEFTEIWKYWFKEVSRVGKVCCCLHLCGDVRWWFVNDKLVNHFCNDSPHISLLWNVVHFSLLWPQQ